jgi:hypothetical protein
VKLAEEAAQRAQLADAEKRREEKIVEPIKAEIISALEKTVLRGHGRLTLA